MEIKNNIIKHYLKNCYFIIGTAYAGKSTTCKHLADKFDMILCEENYNSEVIFQVINSIDQPALSYFSQMPSWQAFLNRQPPVYTAWIDGNNQELSGFEVLELAGLSRDKKVIVDSNIPLEILKEITEPHQVMVMLSPAELSAKSFFDRQDEEKLFLLDQIKEAEDPETTYNNFKSCIEHMSRQHYLIYKASGYEIIDRGYDKWLSLEETSHLVAKHFKLI